MTKSTIKYSNNARSSLSVGITSGDTSLPLINSVGFPSIIATGDHFYVTLDNGVAIEIVKVTGVSGNTLTGCTRGQEGTTAQTFASGTPVENRLTAGNITNFTRFQDRLFNVSSIEVVEAPSATDANSLVCASTDPTGAPILVVAAGSKWRLVNYPDVIRTGTVGSGSTSTSMQITSASSIFIDTTAKVYIIQFTSGANSGRLRFLTTISGSTLNWATALPAALSFADSFEIYRCISTWKAPLGSQSDRIFFENDNRVWFDYSIPSNRNASTTGPVAINSGVTVTVPLGSAWSIL